MAKSTKGKGVLREGWNFNKKLRFVFAGSLGLKLEQLPTLFNWMIAELHNNRINEIGENAEQPDLRRHPNTKRINEVLELMAPIDPFTRAKLKPAIQATTVKIMIERPSFVSNIDFNNAHARGKEVRQVLYEILSDINPQEIH